MLWAIASVWLLQACFMFVAGIAVSSLQHFKVGYVSKSVLFWGFFLINFCVPIDQLWAQPVWPINEILLSYMCSPKYSASSVCSLQLLQSLQRGCLRNLSMWQTSCTDAGAGSSFYRWQSSYWQQTENNTACHPSLPQCLPSQLGFTHSPQLHMWASQVPVGVCMHVCMWERVCYCAPSKTQKGINPFNLTKALLSMHYLTSVLLQITTVFVPLSFLEEIPEEWVLHSIELKGRRDIWPLEMLQECQRDILIFFLFCLYKLKKILPLCAAAVSEVSKAESLFLTMSTEL